VHCAEEKRVVPSTQVDHVVPWQTGRTEAERERLFWDEKNWQALCAPHHSHKTGLEVGFEL